MLPPIRMGSPGGGAVGGPGATPPGRPPSTPPATPPGTPPTTPPGTPPVDDVCDVAGGAGSGGRASCHNSSPSAPGAKPIFTYTEIGARAGGSYRHRLATSMAAFTNGGSSGAPITSIDLPSTILGQLDRSGRNGCRHSATRPVSSIVIRSVTVPTRFVPASSGGYLGSSEATRRGIGFSGVTGTARLSSGPGGAARG